MNRKKLEKVSYCSYRDLQEFCEKEWINQKHLNQVLGNNKNNIKRLNEASIKNFSELSKLDPKKKIEKGAQPKKKIRIKQGTRICHIRDMPHSGLSKLTTPGPGFFTLPCL